MSIQKTVFISYRRNDAAWALAVFQDLTANGFDAFFDFDGISNGEFEPIIEANIRARAHFLVLLTPTALDRCADPGDWLRREVCVALDSGRNIIPIFLDGFHAQQRYSDPVISRLLKFNALSVPVAFFPEAMKRLREKYLTSGVDVKLDLPTERAREVAERARSLALRQAIASTNSTVSEDDALMPRRARISAALAILASAIAAGTYAWVYQGPTVQRFMESFGDVRSAGREPISYATDYYFDLHSDRLSREGAALLDDLASKVLRPTVQIDRITIYAYEASNDTYTEEQLLHLTQRRADAVKDYLVSKGLPTGKITAAGMGTVVDRGNSDTQGGRAKSRYAEIVVRGWRVAELPTK